MLSFDKVGKGTIAGLLFMAIAVGGLITAWDYPTGTALRMGTGYVPKVLCWLLLGLGAATVWKSRQETPEAEAAQPFRLLPLILVPLSLLVFALLVEKWGLLIGGGLLILIGGLAQDRPRILEICITGGLLLAMTWAIFIWALGMTLPALPGG